MNVVEMTITELEYYINVSEKAVAGLERTGSNFEGYSLLGKMLSNSIACCREIFRERKGQPILQTSLVS
jgi:hypothetical protein